jgi:hypothetical protein
MKKKRGISAISYIKGNKFRVFLLVLGFGIFITMNYGSAIIMDSSVLRTTDSIMRQSNKFQIIENSQNISADFVDFFQHEEKVEHIFPCDIINTHFNIIIVPKINLQVGYLVGRENVQTIMDHVGAYMISGELPIKDKQVIVDELYAKNQNLQLGDPLKNDRYDLEIVGILRSDCYLMVGVSEFANDSNCVLVLSSGKDIDYRQRLESAGFDTSSLIIVDSVSRKNNIKRYTDSANEVSDLIKAISALVIMICLMVMFNMYLKDRCAEWCYYYVIGFSKLDIYLSVLWELLFTVAASVVLGILGILLVFFLAKYLILFPFGFKAILLLPDQGLKSLVYIWLMFALLQPIIYFNLQKIDTIDTMEEEFI